MATSPLTARIAYDTSDHAAYDGVDAGQSIVLANNTLHAADSSAQVLHAWTCATSRGPERTPGEADIWYRLWTAPPHFIRTVEDRSYRVRCRIRARTINATGTLEAAVVYSPAGIVSGDLIPRASGDPVVGFVDFWQVTSASSGWLSAYDPFGSGNYGDGLVTLGSPWLADALVTAPTSRALGGDVTTVDYYSGQLSVWVRRTAGSVNAGFRLTGFYAAEYVGL